MEYDYLARQGVTDYEVDRIVGMAHATAQRWVHSLSLGDIITLIGHQHSGGVRMTEAETRFVAIAVTQALGSIARMTPADIQRIVDETV